MASKFERMLQRIEDEAEGGVRRLFGDRYEETIRHLEAGYTKRFAYAAKGLPNVQTDDLEDDRLTVLGRHHGLVTRLLDWTYSPYVAAFFAFDDLARESPQDEFFPDNPYRPHDRVAVWSLFPAGAMIEKSKIEVIDDRLDSFHRQTAQRGLFTRLRDNACFDLESHLTPLGLGHYLECITIPAVEVGKALHDLYQMGIDHTRLFPDLDGAARFANAPSNPSSGGIVAGVTLDVSDPYADLRPSPRDALSPDSSGIESIGRETE